MLEVGPVILAGSLNFGKFTGHRAPGKAMLAYLGAFLAFLALGVQAEVEFKHHNNTEMAAVLQQVHNRCPDITRLYTLSEPSVNGIPLYVLEFTDNPGKHELLEPEMKYIANMHPSPKQRLMPKLAPHTTVDTTDTPDTVVDTDMVDTVVDTDTVPDTTAVDTDTDTAVDTDTVMAVNLNIKLHSVATRGPLR